MLTSQSSVLWDLQPGYRSFILCVENYFIEVSAPFAVFILMTSIQKNPVTLCRLELPGFEDARQVVESLHRMPIKENQAERNRWPAVNSQVCPPPSGAAHINESSELYTQLPSLSHPHAHQSERSLDNEQRCPSCAWKVGRKSRTNSSLPNLKRVSQTPCMKDMCKCPEGQAVHFVWRTPQSIQRLGQGCLTLFTVRSISYIYSQLFRDVSNDLQLSQTWTPSIIHKRSSASQVISWSCSSVSRPSPWWLDMLSLSQQILLVGWEADASLSSLCLLPESG